MHFGTTRRMSNFKIKTTSLIGAELIEVNEHKDGRGLFARYFCDKELEGLLDGKKIVNINYSKSKKKGTLRGLHFQLEPGCEKKFVRCISGGIYDVIVDLRPDSKTFLKWYGVELTSSNRCMLYVPEGFAHGYQTLSDDSEVMYFVTEYYMPENEAGLRFDDANIGINWPLDISEISEKDKMFDDYI